MSSSARLASTTRFLQRLTFHEAYPSLLWSTPSTYTSPNRPPPFLRTFSLSATQFDSDKALPRRKEEKDDDDAPPDQMEHRVPRPVFRLLGRMTFLFTRSTLTDAALTTIIGLMMGKYLFGYRKSSPHEVAVFAGGVAYLAWYKKRVLDKVVYHTYTAHPNPI